MAEPALEPTRPCRQQRHRLCGGRRCGCSCHGDQPPLAPPTWDTAVKAIFGDCINRPHTQVGPCVYCVPCGRRLYQGSVIPAAEMAELRAALALEAGDG